LANLFTDVPTEEPTQLVAGDIWQWKRTDLGTDYPNDSYTLKYSCRLENSGATEIEITASASGSDYLVSVIAATTAAYTAGFYHWQAYITRDSDSERVTIGSGVFEVFANKDAATSDPRSHAKIMVDKIESLLEGRADADVSTYSIQGRSLTKLSIDDLIKWRNYYKRELFHLEKQERRKRGKGTGGLIKVSFS
jgi:hypothetical protein